MEQSMGTYRMAHPVNEPILSYAPGSPERKKLEAALTDLKSKQIEVPLVIDGKEIRTDKKVKITAPHDHNLLLGYAYHGGKKETEMAIESAMRAHKTWSAMPKHHRAAIFLKAADLLAGPYRYIVNAATMLAHSKNAYQAEIDAVCELVDFFRFNAYYMQVISDIQPINPGIGSITGHWRVSFTPCHRSISSRSMATCRPLRLCGAMWRSGNRPPVCCIRRIS
jgi:1-pyrroline-5-carboxylate dehydrogenase